MTFARLERLRQKTIWAESQNAGHLLPSGVQLSPGFAPLNILPQVREEASAYFSSRNIAWHRHANHALSSQVACINFLMPLAARPGLLAEVIGRAVGEQVKMLCVETERQEPSCFVAFEWVGRNNYLGEWGKGLPVRGQNVTSTDAMVQFDAGRGCETLLIEWKYTEVHGNPTLKWMEGNATRIERYKDKAFDPDGPIRSDLNLKVEDFLFEPVYQLFRQQMLALRMQRAGEDGTTRVRVLHISPRGNAALHKLTAPALSSRGSDVFDVFRSVLVDSSAFIRHDVEDLFGPLVSETGHDITTQAWIEGLGRRYAFLLDRQIGDA